MLCNRFDSLLCRKVFTCFYITVPTSNITIFTDYLFTNLKKTNIEKTIEKIEMINNLDIIDDN